MTPEQVKEQEELERQESLAAARKIAVEALRNNPQNFVQVKMTLGNGYDNNGEDSRCADGLLCDTFHVPFIGRSVMRGNAYDDLGKIIGPEWPDKIIMKNDCEGLSFKQIGDWLAEQWGV